MQALGLIETKGLIAAIESADVMLKAAEVRLIERTLVGGGLVTVVVTGDVGAVKAAVEAGAAAVKQLDGKLLLSEHVIPRPTDELAGRVISQGSVVLNVSDETKAEILKEIVEASNEKIESKVTKASNDISTIDISEEINKEALDKMMKEYGKAKVLDALKALKVTKLRNLAREYKDFGISGRLISKADKAILINEFEKYFKKN